MQLDGIVVVSGLPGSGKSTLAHQIYRPLRAGLICKDAIKEILWEELGVDVVDESRKIGQAAVRLMYEMAAHAPSAVLESFFWPGVSERDLLALDRPMVQIYCECPVEVAVRRYRERALDPQSGRHPRHVPSGDVEAKISRWRSLDGVVLDLGVPLLRVDTTKPVIVDEVVEFVESQLPGR